MPACWSVTEDGFSAKTSRAYEGLFTLGSGYLHVRGALEEGLRDCPQNTSYARMPANVTAEKFPETKSKWGTFVPGVYGPHPLLNSELINLPFFLEMALAADGQRLDAEGPGISGWRRELRLDSAELVRSLVWTTGSGKTLDLVFERLVSAARPGLCLQRLTVSARQAAELALAAGIDADVRTNGFDHLTGWQFAARGSDGVSCRVRTNGGDEVAMVSRLVSPAGGWTLQQEERRARLCGGFRVPAGGRLVFEKRTAVATSRDLRPGDPEATLTAAAGLGYDQLRAEHAAVWAGRWERSDVRVDGDAGSQLALRVAIHHLLRAHVPGDARVAIDAKGYAGEGYFGRFFWDTEMCLLPFYLYTAPEAARTLVDFRVNTLDGARCKAAAGGYPGAQYAWESDVTGRECCPNWQYGDHEVHVTADVAYGLAHYARAAGQPEYLRGPAAGVLVETARYWLARCDRRPGESTASLLGVMGADEYTPISDNNCWTNRMVSEALRLAAGTGEHGGASAGELRDFARVAGELPILRRPDGLVLQCEGFDRLADPRFAGLWRDRSRPFAAQVPQERIYRSACLKQADVLMAMAVFPDDFSDAEVARAWDYYLPRTTHDSSLSPAAHALVAARLGRREEAWDFWQRGSGLDLDAAGGGAAEGLHIAAAGGVWQMAVLGFAGMRTAMQSERLTFRPCLPAAWQRLAFPLVWKGCRLEVEVTPGRVRVANRGQRELEVEVAGQVRRAAAGGEAVFEAKG